MPARPVILKIEGPKEGETGDILEFRVAVQNIGEKGDVLIAIGVGKPKAGVVLEVDVMDVVFDYKRVTLYPEDIYTTKLHAIFNPEKYGNKLTIATFIRGGDYRWYPVDYKEVTIETGGVNPAILAAAIAVPAAIAGTVYVVRKR